VRENSSTEYSACGTRQFKGEPYEFGTEMAIFSRPVIERLMRFAFRTAQSRPRKHLTVVTKSNAMIHGMVLWDEVASDIAKEFPDVKWQRVLVDAMTVHMVSHPASLDTIVGTNLHADILTDLAAALAGSIGLAISANINDESKEFPPLFEAIHGSAPDIAGQGIANPIATIWAGAEMCNYLGEKKAAELIVHAIEHCTEHGLVTKDLGGTLSTKQVTAAVIDYIEQQ